MKINKRLPFIDKEPLMREVKTSDYSFFFFLLQSSGLVGLVTSSRELIII